MVKEKKNSLINKIGFYNNIFLVIVLVATIGVMYYFFNAQLIGQFRDRLMDVAKAAAITIDVNKHEHLKTRQDENTLEYKQIKALLKKFKDVNKDVAYVYTMRKSDKPDEWQFVVDAAEGKDASHIGDLYDVSKQKQMKQAFDGPTADTTFETDQWGKFLSGYAPIYDQDGNAVGIVGVDIRANDITRQQDNILLAAGIILIVVIIISFLGSRFVAGQFLKPIKHIKEESKKLRKNKEYKLSMQTYTEFKELAQIINDTVGNLMNSGNNLQKKLATSVKEKDEFHYIYSNLIKELSGGKLRLATPQEMKIYLTDGLILDTLEIEKEEDIVEILEAIQKFAVSIEESRFQQIKKALTEAITNVVIHAEKGQLTIKKKDNKLRFVISDKGPGMSLMKIPHNIFVNANVSEIPDKGFSLLYKNADNIIFTSSKEGTIIILDFNFTDNSEQELS